MLHASVAQLAEQLICNQQVAGSSPAAGSSGASPRGPLLRLAARSLETRTDHEEDTGAPWPSRRVLDRPPPGSTCDRFMRVAASGERCARTGPPIRIHTGRFPSGQRGQTVNLMALPSQVRILFSPPPPPHGGGPMEHARQRGCGAATRATRAHHERHARIRSRKRPVPCPDPPCGRNLAAAPSGARF